MMRLQGAGGLLRTPGGALMAALPLHVKPIIASPRGEVMSPRSHHQRLALGCVCFDKCWGFHSTCVVKPPQGCSER